MKNSFLRLLFLLIITFGYAQKEVYYPEYNHDNLKDGTYEIKSFSQEFLKENLPVINPEIDAINLAVYPYFLNPYRKEIVLFNNHDLKKLNPIGILNDLALVSIDSTFYKYKYKDFTNCVWNRIIINGKYFYTDADIHDYSLTKELTNFNQKVIIVGQDTGYDGGYHLGYPEYFFMIFTNNENKIIFRTDVLDFNSGDEFAIEEDILYFTWIDKDELYEITLIGINDEIKVYWDGQKAEIKKL